MGLGWRGVELGRERSGAALRFEVRFQPQPGPRGGLERKLYLSFSLTQVSHWLLALLCVCGQGKGDINPWAFPALWRNGSRSCDGLTGQGLEAEC